MANKLNRRKRLWKKFKNCFVCLQPILSLDDCTIEHIIPRSKGGANTLRNLGVSHPECNRMRGNILCRLVWTLQLGKKADYELQKIIKAWKKKMVEKVPRHF